LFQACNLGYVYGNLTYINFNNACIDVAGSGDPNAVNFLSLFPSKLPLIVKIPSDSPGILNACPKSDLSIVGIQDKVASTQNPVGRSADNRSILDDGGATCVSQFNYPYYGKAFNPLKPGADEPGSEPLSNLPGNAFTEFGAPAYTLKLFPGYTSVITPAAFNEKAGAVTQTINAGSVGISITATPSGTGSATGTVKGGVSTTGKNTGTAASASASATKSSRASRPSFNTLWTIIVPAIVWYLVVI
jgi:hypothetical protein